MFGSHLSIAGGLHNAILEAEILNCDTVQIFTICHQLCMFIVVRLVIAKAMECRLNDASVIY